MPPTNKPAPVRKPAVGPLPFDDYLESLGLDPDILREYLAALHGGEPVVQEDKERVVVYQNSRVIAFIPFKCLEKPAAPQRGSVAAQDRQGFNLPTLLIAAVPIWPKPPSES